MKREKEKHPTHDVGLHFPDGDVGATVRSFRQDQTVFDCFDYKQISQTTPDAWLTRGHPAIYASIFAKQKKQRTIENSTPSVGWFCWQ